MKDRLSLFNLIFCRTGKHCFPLPTKHCLRKCNSTPGANPGEVQFSLQTNSNEMLNKSRQTWTPGGLWAGSATEIITFIYLAPRSNIPSYSSWASSFRYRFRESPGLSLPWECLLWGFICREKGLSSQAGSNHFPQLLHTSMWNCFRRF